MQELILSFYFSSDQFPNVFESLSQSLASLLLIFVSIHASFQKLTSA